MPQRRQNCVYTPRRDGGWRRGAGRSPGPRGKIAGRHRCPSFDPERERRNVRLISVVAVMINGNDGEPIVDALLDTLAERYRWRGRAPWRE